VSMIIIEGLIAMLLLMDTPLGCNFVTFYQTQVVSVGFIAGFVTQWLSGLIADVTGDYSHKVLLFTLALCIVIDFVMFFYGESEYVILVLLAARYGSITLLRFCTDKLFKTHLIKYNTPEKVQLQRFNLVSAWGENGGRIFVTLFSFTLPFFLIKYGRGYVTFGMIKMITLAVAMTNNILAIIATCTIKSDYFASGPSSGSYRSAGSQNKILEQEDGVEEIDLETFGTSEERRDDTKDGSNNIGDENDDVKIGKRNSFREYCFESVSAFFKVSLIWHISIQLIIGGFFFGFVNIILRFDLAIKDNTAPIANYTKDNFCGNFLSNLIFQTIVNEIFTISASLFYTVFLVHMRPYYFYSRIIFLFNAILLGASISTFFPLGYIVSSLFLGLLFGVNLMLRTYSSATQSSVIPSSAFGFIHSIQGSFFMLSILASSLLSYFKFSSFVNSLILVGVLVFSIAFNVFLYLSNKNHIISLDLKKKDFDFDTSPFLRKWIYGYSDETNDVTSAKYAR
jgi:hypothetical protein